MSSEVETLHFPFSQSARSKNVTCFATGLTIKETLAKAFSVRACVRVAVQIAQVCPNCLFCRPNCSGLSSKGVGNPIAKAWKRPQGKGERPGKGAKVKKQYWLRLDYAPLASTKKSREMAFSLISFRRRRGRKLVVDLFSVFWTFTILSVSRNAVSP